ncbi:hypothetical protein TR75_01470 [Hydrogenibacillus schlegelii]|uniref:Uncharacterized protein n=1 Tax=Hydrogenibacillus schlegelii TaxID=1484 RepID=A0A132NDC2_HYDSH|nr:hypothetical protein TR75_01470 [Hydrogenibacillus schlegelii]OAR04609.1 hypothetical protein SA87_08700 [Hydrogenibacillus schlegelii]
MTAAVFPPGRARFRPRLKSAATQLIGNEGDRLKANATGRNAKETNHESDLSPRKRPLKR